MKISVLFSTFNGANVIADVLEGYCKQVTDIEWQLIVVNNVSTDTTQEIIDSFQDRLPITTFVHNIPGKNSALNAALPLINGEFVIVTDDDAIPEQNFIANWKRLAEAQPKFDLFGGKIIPSFIEQPQKWMLDNQFHFEEVFACRNLISGPINAKDIYGPNMAVRKRIFDAGIRFNEDIGPNGSNKNYPMGSETEFCGRVSEAGYLAYFNQEAVVSHIVRPHQVLPSFWKHRAYKHGLGHGMQDALKEKNSVSEIPLLLVTMTSRVLRNYIASILKKEMLIKNEKKWQVQWDLGYTFGKSKQIWANK